MKKTNVQPLQEVKAQDIQNVNQYVEQLISLLSQNLMGATDGVIQGMQVSLLGNNIVSIASGAIFQQGLFGQLESASGQLINLSPTSANKYDTIAAYYQEVLDTPQNGYILLDVVTRIETIQSNPTRRLGAALIKYLENTPASGCPSGYIALAQVTSTSGGITLVDNSVVKTSTTAFGATVPVTRIDTGSTVTVSLTDKNVICSPVGTPYVVNVNLPTTSIVGSFYRIKDGLGKAFQTNIIVNAPAGQNIDGQSTDTIRVNWQAKEYYYLGSNKWSVM
jgi:hypothetical protein